MNIEVEENGHLALREVFNSVTLISNHGERMTICMRDQGFEFTYEGIKFEAKEGILKEMKSVVNKDHCPTIGPAHHLNS